MPDLTIKFDNEAAKQHFMHWLCGQGEQDYWLWMECRELENQGDITILKFNYHNGNGKTDIQKFNNSSLITTECGRIDRSE